MAVQNQNPYAMQMTELRRAMEAENAPPAPQSQGRNHLAEFAQLAGDGYDPAKHEQVLIDTALWAYLQTGQLPTAQDLYDIHAMNHYQGYYQQAAPEPPLDPWTAPLHEVRDAVEGIERPGPNSPELMPMDQLRDQVLGIERGPADQAWAAPMDDLKVAMLQATEQTNEQG